MSDLRMIDNEAITVMAHDLDAVQKDRFGYGTVHFHSNRKNPENVRIEADSRKLDSDSPHYVVGRIEVRHEFDKALSDVALFLSPDQARELGLKLIAAAHDADKAREAERKEKMRTSLDDELRGEDFGADM